MPRRPGRPRSRRSLGPTSRPRPRFKKSSEAMEPRWPGTACPEGDRRPGRRVAVRKGAPENRFDTQGQGKWSQIHADANGAYNILRKACPGFRRAAGVRQQGGGLAAMRQASREPCPRGMSFRCRKTIPNAP